MHDPFASVPTAPPTVMPPPPPDWANGTVKSAPANPSYAARTLSSVGGLATAVKALTGATAFAAMLSFATAMNEYRVIGRWDRLEATVNELDTAAAWVAATVFLELFLLVVTGICTIVLLWRMNNNAEQLQGRQLEHKTHWALWGWFVPFLNLARPMQMVRQIWGAADDPGGRHLGQPGALGHFARRQGTTDVPISTWWALWVGSNILAFVWPSASWQNPTTDELRTELVGMMVGSVLTVISAVAFIYMLSQLVPRQLASAKLRGFNIR